MAEVKQETIQDDELVSIQLDIDSALNYRERRHDDFNENYSLYRDKVITNRLTQRQTINVPLMKYGINTILKDVSEPPILIFKSLSGNEQKEIYYNSVWMEFAKENKLKIKDKIDKKQGALYGRTFKKLNIENGKFTFEVIDPQDMLVERHVDPAILDTARCLIQTGIYRTLKEILENENYDNAERNRLKKYFEEDQKEQEEANYNDYVEKQQRLLDMGLIDAFDPVVGETYIELNEVYRKEFDPKEKRFIIYLYVVASTDDGLYKLSKTRLSELLGDTGDDYWDEHFPFTSWAVDVERTDFWSDGQADIIRQPNKALNNWMSQLSENRTLRNFNMHYYDASNSNFVPQTFTPEPWGWYGVPGNPNDIVKDVVIGDLSESLDEMSFVINIAEKAIGASSVQTGDVQGGKVTLGEVELALTNAQQRTKGMEVDYTDSWEEFGMKYIKLLEGSADKLDDEIEVQRKGREGKGIYTKKIKVSDLYDKKGWAVEVTTKQNQQTEDANKIQKMQIAKSEMPTNMALQKIYKKHLLEFAGFTSDEIEDVMRAEDEQTLLGQVQPMAGLPVEGQQPNIAPLGQ